MPLQNNSSRPVQSSPMQKNKKKNMNAVGMPNQYQKEKITISGVKLDSHDTDTNKILRQEGIYNIKVLEDLIITINKNKQLCRIF